MLDPTAAVIEFGENPSTLLSPTVTVYTPGVEDDVVVAGSVEVVAELAGDPPLYYAKANGNKQNRIGWLEIYLFH
jgi:hypothetical protein